MIPERIRDGWRSGRAAWPGVEVTQDEFAAYVSERTPASPPEAEDARLRYEDLYLACACARGDAAGLRAFESTFFPEIDVAVAKVGGAVPSAAEVGQVLRHRLFVGEGDTRPKIAEFSGRGELRVWFRITATRVALTLASRAAREAPTTTGALTLLLGSGDDPELSYLKQHYAEEFKRALEEAFEALDSRERTLLGYAFRDGLTLAAIGSLYDVHRATAARWVVEAHSNLARCIRKALISKLGVNDKDYSSILRLIESRLDITLDRCLNG